MRKDKNIIRCLGIPAGCTLWVNGSKARMNTKLKPGDVITIGFPKKGVDHGKKKA